MTTSGPHATDQLPTARAVRFWLGLLLVIQFIAQISAVGWGYVEISNFYQGEFNVVQYWHDFAVAIACALLAMVTIVACVGLILHARWSWRVALAMAICQILVTVGTQVWEAMGPPSSDNQPPAGAILAALVGIILWSIIPVGIIVLAAAGRPKQAE